METWKSAIYNIELDLSYGFAILYIPMQMRVMLYIHAYSYNETNLKHLISLHFEKYKHKILLRKLFIDVSTMCLLDQYITYFN